MKKFMAVLAVITALSFVGCGNSKDQIMDGDGMFNIKQYKQITQEEAKRMMEQEEGHVIVDVRRQEEYAEGHIPGAILIPNESIEVDPPEEIPDLNQIILVYCRTGRRSKEASQKLADMGYSNVYEFGGIVDWTGDIEKGMGAAMGEAYGDMSPTAILTVSVGDNYFSIDIENNSSAEEFFEKIKEDNLKIVMHDYGGFEKVGELPWRISRNDEDITTKPGDLILYQGNQITVYYDENTWSFTKLGHLNGTEDEIREAFGGKEDVTAEFSVEWTE